MLPIIQTPDRQLNNLQTLWASQLNKLLDNPLLQGIILENVVLASGDNTINHKLGRTLQGYIVTRYKNAAAAVYDKQSTNKMPELTLVLNSSAATTVNLYVF